MSSRDKGSQTAQQPVCHVQAIEERHLSNRLASSSSPGVVPNPLDAEDDASFGETSGSLHSHSSTSSGALPEPQVLSFLSFSRTFQCRFLMLHGNKAACATVRQQ